MSKHGMFSSELFRMIEGTVTLGRISALDYDALQVRVTHNEEEGGQQSAWLPWPTEVGNNFTHWRPLRIGAQVILLAESGDLANAVIVGMLYSPAAGINAPTKNPAIDRIQFDDGTAIEYDSSTQTLSASSVRGLNLSAAQEINIDTQTLNVTALDINITGDRTIKGDTDKTGNTKVQGDTTLTGSNTLVGNSSVQGNIGMQGKLTASAVSAGGIEFDQHTHGYTDDGNPRTTSTPR